MFNQIFVPFLVQQKLLTAAQAEEALEAQSKTRIRLGTLAVEEGVMTEGQVEQVNRLQASQNARFGDIAIQKGYLTLEKVDALLCKQPGEHLVLKQILSDKHYMSTEQTEAALTAFQASLAVNGDVFVRLQQNDMDAYIKYIAGIGDHGETFLFNRFANLFITTVFRLIDREVCIKKAFMARIDTKKHLIYQGCKGDASVTFAFAPENENAALAFAERYAKILFNTLDEDVQDSLKEFLNCVGGLIISELSNTNTLELDIAVPEYAAEKTIGQETLVLPFSLSIGEFSIFLL